MGKKEEKITRAAHIKKHTKGTSNEISFSVLDAAKNALDGETEGKNGRPHGFGRIPLFTLPARRKKPSGTPMKEQGLPLSNGGFVSSEGKETSGSVGTLDFSADAASRSSSSSPSDSSNRSTSTALAIIPAEGLLFSSASAPAAAKPARSPEEEIARRKARRRLSKALAVAVIAVVTLGLAVAGGLYLYRDYQDQRSNVNKLDSALQLVKEADDTIIAMNSIIEDPFAASSSDQISEIESKLESVTKQLNEADEQARAASAELHDSKDKEAANQTVVTISARRELVKLGPELLVAIEQAQNTVVKVNDVWKQVLEGDDSARAAAKLVTETTAENVQASKDKTNEAISMFNAARTALADAQLAYPAADFSPLSTYIEKRIESLGYATASDDAILAKNKEEATAQNDAYNDADSEAAALAKELPADPADFVYQAFEQATAEVSSSYSTVRSQAGTADAFIRDYLGTDDK